MSLRAALATIDAMDYADADADAATATAPPAAFDWQSLQSRAVRDGNHRRYHRGRRELIAALGGKCVDCDEADADLLEFHHTRRRTWQARKTSRWQRLAHYRREAALGTVVLLCGACNKARGRPRR